MVLLLTIGTIALTAAVVYLMIERGSLKEDLDTQKTKLKATISYAEDLANTVADLKHTLHEKSRELINCQNTKAPVAQDKPRRSRKN